MQIGNMFSIDSWLVVVLLLVVFFVVRSLKRKGKEEKTAVSEELKQVSVPEIIKIKRQEGERLIPTMQVHGTILSRVPNRPSLANVVYGDRFAHRMALLQDSGKVDAVIVEINTPGGTPAGAELIRDAIEQCARVKPVFIQVAQLCASGGMWVLSGLTRSQYQDDPRFPNRVFAQPNAVLGSVGVIAGPLIEFSKLNRVSGLLGQGYEAEEIHGRVLTSGDGKAFGSPFAYQGEDGRAERERAEARYQRLLDTTRGEFIERLTEARGLDPDIFGSAPEQLGAGVVLATEAVKLRFVDGVTTRHELERLIAEGLGVEHGKCHFPVAARTTKSPLRSLLGFEMGDLLTATVLGSDPESQLQLSLRQEHVLALDSRFLTV